jgi:ubiquinone/menaquinone biosynthesis C-methylase UbiE
MGDSETGQVSENAAKIYEAVYLPALFSQWCPHVASAAGIRQKQTVLDVACGTGALTIYISELVGTEGNTVGVDNNDGMLDIARSKSSFVEWINAPAENLPFEDSRFDSVVSQFGLMYFENQEQAIREMIRVVRPRGSLAVAVWNSLDNNPGLAAEERLWQEVLGEAVGEAPYRLGDKRVLERLFKNSGANNFQITTFEGIARFDSIRSWIHAGAKGWAQDEALSEAQLELLLGTAEEKLAEYRTAQDKVNFPLSGRVVTATK